MKMITPRQKVSIALMFVGIALGATAVMASLPRPKGDDHVVYHDDAGAKHPDYFVRGSLEVRTAALLGVGAIAIFVVGFSVREP